MFLGWKGPRCVLSNPVWERLLVSDRVRIFRDKLSLASGKNATVIGRISISPLLKGHLDGNLTTDQIDRIFVGLPRNRPLGSSSRHLQSQKEGPQERNKNANRQTVQSKFQAQNRSANNAAPYRGPRVFFGEKGFIYFWTDIVDLW